MSKEIAFSLFGKLPDFMLDCFWSSGQWMFF